MEKHSQDTADVIIFVGSYTDTMPHVVARGEGISVVRMDGQTGALSLLSTFRDLHNPTYLARSDNGRKLYALEEIAEQDGASAAVLNFDAAAGSLSLAGKATAHGDYPCHVAIDLSGRRLFVSNYGSGNLVTYALNDDGTLAGEAVDIRRSGTGPNPDRQEGPHLHQATPMPDNAHVLVCDAGTDEIALYPLGDELIGTAPDLVVKTKPGGLPRHLVLAKDARHFFVVHELGCCVSTYVHDEAGIRPLSEISTLPEGFAGDNACAAIRLHPNGRFLYASNRGHDSIAAFEIEGAEGRLRSIGWTSTGGKVPRDFAIDPSGRYLVAANQDSHSLVVFEIDPETGMLRPVGGPFEIGSPVCIVFSAI
jgi:6-phosphogluconolactonase